MTLARWQFSASVLLPVILALGITVTTVLGFVFWSTASIDQRALERQGEMVQQALKSRRDRLAMELSASVSYDEAVINTSIDFDPDWIDANIGQWLHNMQDHDMVFLLNMGDRAIYMMQDGVALQEEDFPPLPAPIQMLAQRIRAIPQPLFVSDRPRAPQVITDVAAINGIPSIIGVSTVISTSGGIEQTPGSEYLVAAVNRLDAMAAYQLSQEYLIEDGIFSLSRTENPNRAVFPILNKAGRFVAFFEWDRDRPGLMMLRHTGPVLLGALVVASLLVFLLLRQLRRSSAALEAGRRLAEHEAAHDRLTGLPNRMHFDASLTRVLAERTGPNTNLALLMLDLDRFKQVNDTLGHQAGDQLIREVGTRIRVVVGSDPMIARLGGDEFVILITEREQIDDATAIAGRIIESIGQTFDLAQFKAHVGASIGIVSAAGAGVEPYELMRKADIALYEAKANGRNCAVVYEEHMDELVQLQHTIEGELREALQRDDQLAVVFQPLVDQKTRKVIGAEALARWHHPRFGQISPARFIPVAENTGLIEALGEFVLRRACELGATAPGRTIAVNISPTQLRNQRFPKLVFDILKQTGMHPTDLELEITESILLDDEHITAQNLRTFRDAGIHIALDDFGTGYSSLSYLKRYPVDRIKIDRSFVMQLAEGHVSVAITQAIVTLAHAMDLHVTAEGVETESQATILGQLGCNTLQGFLFSGGVPAERICALFSAQGEVAHRGGIQAAQVA